MEPILYRAEPDGRLTPLRSDVGVRILFAGSWLSLSAGALVARVAAGTIDHGHLVSAKFLLPHRPAALAPYGWAPPVFGHDDLGRPCALILPAEAPPPPTLAEVLPEAQAALSAERNARIDALVGSASGDWRPHVMRTALGSATLAAVALGTATEQEEAQMLASLELLERVEAIDAAATLIAAALDAAQDSDAVAAIAAALPTDARWPA